MRPQTIAITGSTGFVGSHIVRALAADGYKIMAFGRSEHPPEALLECAEYTQWDITHAPAAGAGSTADVFIHTAGFVDFWGSKAAMYRANVDGTANAVALARAMKAKVFIYLSSASVYDPLVDKQNIEESVPYAKRYLNYYAETKVEAEKLLRNESHFESTVILRPHAIYGPGDRTVLPQILSRVKHRRFLLPDSGNARYSITHVGNIVEAARSIIAKPPRGINVLNITDVQPIKAQAYLQEILRRQDAEIKIVKIPYSIGLVAAYVVETFAHVARFKQAPVLTINIMAQLHHDSTMSVERAKQLIAYEGTNSYPEGLNDTFDWIQSLGGSKNFAKHDAQLSWRGKIKSY